MIDTHAHIDFCDEPSDIVLSNAKAAGLTGIIQVGVDAESSIKNADTFKDVAWVYPTIGIHPLYKDAFYQIDQLTEALSDPQHPFVAIGEIGLDYKYEDSDKDAQKQVFISQLEVAKAHGLPVILHNRKADEDIAEILRPYTDTPMVFHCFSSSWSFISPILANASPQAITCPTCKFSRHSRPK